MLNGFYVNELHFVGNLPEINNLEIQYENIKTHAFYLNHETFTTKLIRFDWIDEENHKIYTDKNKALNEVLVKIDNYRKDVLKRIAECQK